MTERLRFFIAGFFIGLAELLPGISGSTVAIAFKVYEKFILFLSNLKISNFSFNFKKLNQVFFLDLIIPFFIAMAISVIFASKLILFLDLLNTTTFISLSEKFNAMFFPITPMPTIPIVSLMREF